eukprot:SAG31_NODE_446_length_15587_cov_29.651989_1_plen_649_part_00
MHDDGDREGARCVCCAARAAAAAAYCAARGATRPHSWRMGQCLLSPLLLFLVLGPCQGPAAARIPSWTAPPFDKSAPVSKTAAYGLPVAQHTAAVKVYNATMDWTGGFGVYSHAPMIAFHGGFFIASWKNGALQEDEPGQRVLWSYASADAPLNCSAPTVLFPNMSSADQPCSSSKNLPPFPTHPPYLSPGCAHLFAEPTVVINDRVYVAASLRQFCLWPLDPLNKNGVYLLLRRVTLAPGVAPELGPVFWAADPGSAWTATNQRLSIRTLDQMDTETQGDIAELLAGERPCAANATKCEYCAGGCQRLRAVGNRSASCTVMDFGGPWIERTRWAVPGNDDTDILVYRAEGQYLCFSQRSGGAAGGWSLPSETKLTDIHSNFNAGTLPDGRVYLLHNPIIGAPHLRDPLVLSLSSDGYAFEKAYVAMSCLLPPVSSHEHPEGCKRRNPGGGSPGPQYSQGLVNGESLYVIMSMNKEDIWVEQIPLSSLATATTALKTDDRDTLPKWPNTSVGIHAFMVGDDYARPPTIHRLADQLSFVMRATQLSAWRASNNPKVAISSYMPYTRDPAPSCHPQPCDMLPWWQQHKPHLVLYRCDRKTPAWECFGGGISCEAGHLSVPLDLARLPKRCSIRWPQRYYRPSTGARTPSN